jgi:uncharacterized protein (DUF302 family)
MLQIRSTVSFDEIELVLKTSAQRHSSTVLVVSHLGQSHQEGGAAGSGDAFVFTLCHSKLYTALLAADIRFAGFLPCRVAAWPDGGGVMLEAMTPSEYCRILGRPDLEPLAAPLEKALRNILEDASGPLAVSARERPGARPSTWAATEDQVNMRAALPQRVDCRGTKVEEEGGTGAHDAPGG